jgi:integrase/recombinase XerD
LCFAKIRKDNPSKSIKLRDKISRDIQLQDLFTSAELETLLTAKKERYANLELRNKVLMSLLIYQALKPNEIAALECDEINLEQATMYIKSSAKNNSRTLVLKANQILLFKKYVDEIRSKLLGQNASKSLLIGHRGIAMTAEDITKHIKRNYAIYKPRKVNALTIRQSVIANLLKQHNDLRIVQSFAGHKYPSTTERYKQNDIEALQEQIKKYHPIQ